MAVFICGLFTYESGCFIPKVRQENAFILFKKKMNPQTSHFAIPTGSLMGVHCGEDHPPLAGVVGGQQDCLDTVLIRAVPVSREQRLQNR